jgi:hypothetical protein
MPGLRLPASSSWAKALGTKANPRLTVIPFCGNLLPTLIIKGLLGISLLLIILLSEEKEEDFNKS